MYYKNTYTTALSCFLKYFYFAWKGYIKTYDIYKDFAEDVETRFDTSNYELDIPLLKGENLKVVGLMKIQLGEKIMTKFLKLRPKTYSYLIDDGSKNKKVKGTKKCVIK